jgi:hypothetical protein
MGPLNLFEPDAAVAGIGDGFNGSLMVDEVAESALRSLATCPHGGTDEGPGVASVPRRPHCADQLGLCRGERPPGGHDLPEVGGVARRMRPRRDRVESRHLAFVLSGLCSHDDVGPLAVVKRLNDRTETSAPSKTPQRRGS